MAKTAAQRQKEYRERLKKKAADGDEHAQKIIKRNSKRSADPYKRALTFIKLHASREQLLELQKLIEKGLEKS